MRSIEAMHVASITSSPNPRLLVRLANGQQLAPRIDRWSTWSGTRVFLADGERIEAGLPFQIGVRLVTVRVSAQAIEIFRDAETV